MTSNITESFRKYKQLIIIVVAAAAISTFMLPLTDANGQSLVRSKAASGRAITSSDLFPNGNMGHGNTGTNNMGNLNNGVNSGVVQGNLNNGVNSGVVQGGTNHGVNNGKVVGSANEGVNNGLLLGSKHITRAQG